MIFIFKSWQLSMTLKISTEIAVDVSVREMKFILNWKIWVSSSNCWPLTDWPCIRSSGWNILISQHENYLVICCWKIFQLAAVHHVTGSCGWCWLSLCYLFHCSYYLTLTDSRMGGNNNVGFLHNSLITLLGFKYFLCHSQSNIFSSQPLTVTLYQLDLTVSTMTDQWFISSQQMTEPNIFQWNIFLMELSNIWLSDCSDVTWCQWCLSDAGWSPELCSPLTGHFPSVVSRVDTSDTINAAARWGTREWAGLGQLSDHLLSDKIFNDISSVRLLHICCLALHSRILISQSNQGNENCFIAARNLNIACL